MGKLTDRINTVSDKLQSAQKHTLSTRSRGSKFYTAFTVCMVILYLLAFSSKPLSMLSGNDQEDILSEDYDQTISIENEYDLKITNAQINDDDKELRFDLLLKRYYEHYNYPTDSEYNVPSITEPKIIKVLFDASTVNEDSADFNVDKNDENKFHSTVTVKLDDLDFDSCVILFEYEKLPYTDSDTVDDFGNIIKGEKHSSEICKCYVSIAHSDFNEVDTWENVEFAEVTTEPETESTPIVTTEP